MLTVNLWDNTFRHDVGSVAGKSPIKIAYVRDRTDWDGVTLFVDGCASPELVSQVNSTYKVGWLHEGPCLHPYDNVDWNGLELVLTYYEPFLSHPKARFVPYGGIWIKRDKWGLRPKTKLCSMLYSEKAATDGHRLRPLVADAVRDLGVVDFYGAEGEKVGYGAEAKERALADYAFSIVIQACNEQNLFSEWLCDCLAVGTVPIFWGCPNYGKWFNEHGIIPFQTLDGVRWIVGSLRMSLYHMMLGAVHDNLQRVAQYEITDDLVADALVAEGFA